MFTFAHAYSLLFRRVNLVALAWVLVLEKFRVKLLHSMATHE